MRGAKGKLALVAVLEAHELRAVGAPAAGLAPELAVSEDGHEHLLRTNALHLVANDEPRSS